MGFRESVVEIVTTLFLGTREARKGDFAIRKWTDFFADL